MLQEAKVNNILFSSNDRVESPHCVNKWIEMVSIFVHIGSPTTYICPRVFLVSILTYKPCHVPLKYMCPLGKLST